MAVELRVTGAEQLRALGNDLRAAGETGKGLRRELLASMRALEKPLTAKVLESARDHLPRAGGLNEWVAGSRIAFRNNLTGSASRIGARIVATKGKHDLSDMDESGSIRHPVYGNRKAWVSQTVESGWFSKPLNESVPELQAAMLVAMEVVAKRIEKG